MTILWLIFSFLTFAIGYGLGLFMQKRNANDVIDALEDVEELLKELEELGFLTFEINAGISNDPTINDLKKLIEESEFSSFDEMFDPNTETGESHE